MSIPRIRAPVATASNAARSPVTSWSTRFIETVTQPRSGTEKAIAPVVHHRGRLGRMVHSAVGFLALEGIILLYALIVISPLALLAALIWAWRRRSIERLLAA